MKKFLIAVVVIIVLLVGALVAVPLFVPTETYKQAAVDEVRAATGRELTIAGDVSLSLFPSVGLKVARVSLANAPGGQAEQMFSVAQVVLDVPIGPLLSGNLQIDRFLLVDPVINLEVDADGVPNWQMTSEAGAAETAATTETAAAGEAAPSEDGEASAMPGVVLNDIRVQNGTIQYSDLRTGKSTVVAGVDGTLNLSRLDLGALQGGGGAAAAAQTANTNDWSDAPIDLSALKAVDLDFVLEVDSIDAAGLKVGESALDVAVKSGQLIADLKQLALYDGDGTGRFTADGNTAAPALTGKFDLKQVNALGLLGDLGITRRLEGTLALELDLAATGASERQLVSDLSGKGAFGFTDGALIGVDLAEIAGQLQDLTQGESGFDVAKIATLLQGLFTGGSTAQKTDFARLNGTFTALEGVIQNTDTCMIAPGVRMTGTTDDGGISMPRRTVDYTARLAVADAQVTPDAVCDPSAGVAVAVIGPWSQPAVTPKIDVMSTIKSTVDSLMQDGGEGAETIEEQSEKVMEGLKKLFD